MRKDGILNTRVSVEERSCREGEEVLKGRREPDEI